MFSFNDKIAGFAMIWATLTTGCAIDAVGTDDADLDQVGIDEANAEPRDSTADPLGGDKRGALVASSKSEMLPSKGYVGKLAVRQAGFSQQAPLYGPQGLKGVEGELRPGCYCPPCPLPYDGPR
ncbi:hypothetical protein [Sorangium sp. So ce124]|uniref:hypothetical protein n=1 Tax=Sorangium sp. So ce124 TaxID=3133280 RepID=UPI003F6134C7